MMYINYIIRKQKFTWQQKFEKRKIQRNSVYLRPKIHILKSKVAKFNKKRKIMLRARNKNGKEKK